MSADNFFRKFNKKPETASDTGDEKKDLPESTDPDSEHRKDENPQKSFLDIIEDLAIRQKSNLPDNYGRPVRDLSAISIDDYQVVGSNERLNKKIEELKSIILSIENRPADTTGVQLTRSYKINYGQELNPAQFEAATNINGPVLVIAGAGSGKTRVIVYRVAFMMENGIDPGNILLLTFTRKAANEMLG
ncbi:MAG: UvrD-helicase domain-containing protein, partial [Bacteroidales bacterium]